MPTVHVAEACDFWVLLYYDYKMQHFHSLVHGGENKEMEMKVSDATPTTCTTNHNC